MISNVQPNFDTEHSAAVGQDFNEVERLAESAVELMLEDEPTAVVGMKFDGHKTRFDLIPPHAEDLVAKVLTFGSRKYSANNWKLVEDGERRYLGAALRHIHAHRRGEVLDPESNLPHLAHAVCCLMFIMELEHELG